MTGSLSAETGATLGVPEVPQWGQASLTSIAVLTIADASKQARLYDPKGKQDINIASGCNFKTLPHFHPISLIALKYRDGKKNNFK